MRRRSLLGLAVALAACADTGNVLGPREPALDILDGRSETGNPHFYWLPPIGAPNPGGGAPAADVAPEVRVCARVADACGDEVAVFTTSGTDGAGLVRRDATGGHYVAEWPTGEAYDGAGLDPAVTYRIRVLLGGNELGFADVRQATGTTRRDVDATAFVIVQPGQTLPIRFVIEEGAGEGNPAEPPAAIQRRAIASAAGHSCALTTDGSAWCWGGGWSGELGNGAFGDAAAPVAVAGDHRFLSLALGNAHSCGIDEAGAAWCWGSNSGGILGTGVAGGTQSTPIAVTGGLVFAQIEAGSSFTCGRTNEGAVHCWGRGGSGQLGNGTTLNSATPVPVGGDLAFVTIDLGSDHACGLTAEGTAWCWGGNQRGQLGNGGVATSYPYVGSTTPQPVAGGLAFTAISAGGSHTCALTAAGEAWCWGAGFDGQLGEGATEQRTEPVAVGGAHAFRSIDAGISHTCAVDGAGVGWCWGSNGFAETGTAPAGSPVRVLEPTAVQGAFTWGDIRGGQLHTCGVTSAGQGMCWGFSNLGTGSTVPSDSPVPIAGDLVLPAG